MYRRQTAVELDGGTIASVLMELGQLNRSANPDDRELLESLRPHWLTLDAWDIVLDELTVERYLQAVG